MSFKIDDISPIKQSFNNDTLSTTNIKDICRPVVTKSVIDPKIVALEPKIQKISQELPKIEYTSTHSNDNL